MTSIQTSLLLSDTCTIFQGFPDGCTNTKRVYLTPAAERMVESSREDKENRLLQERGADGGREMSNGCIW